MYVYIPQPIVLMVIVFMLWLVLGLIFELLASYWSMLRRWAWVKGSAHLKFHESYDLVCYEPGSMVPFNKQIDAILLSNARPRWAPRITGLLLVTPGVGEEEVLYQAQSTAEGVLLSFDKPVVKPPNAIEQSRPALVLSLESRWRKKQRTMRFEWEGPPPLRIPHFYQHVLDQERAILSDNFDLEAALEVNSDETEG